MKLLVICGSLREKSYNRMLANTAIELAPEGIQFEFGQFAEIPHYNQDLDPSYNKALTPGDKPGSVRRLCEQIDAADGVLFVSPEYNYSIPGVLKNAIDWVSRGQSPLRGKPVGIMGASMGMGGTLRMQQHIRAVFQFLDAPCMMQPEVIVPTAHTRFDADGKLTDEATKGFVKSYIEAFEKWVESHRKATR